MRRHRGTVALTAVVFVVAAACGRSGDQVRAARDGDGSGATRATRGEGGNGGRAAGRDAGGLRAGEFGDLGQVCGPAPDGADLAATDVGVTADAIQVSTVSDPGFAGRPGLNQELFDTAEAFTRWCNAAGGINGRRIELELRDAKLTEFQTRMLEACEEGDFMLVGGGAVFDDTGQQERLACGLPNVAGFVVTAPAIEADLTVQPVPNPVYSLAAGEFHWLEEQFPDAVDHIGVFTGNIPTTVTVAERYGEAMRELGWNVVWDEQYNAAGESTWRPFAESLKSAGVRGLVYVGEPVNLAAFLRAVAEIEYELDFVRADANHYDPLLVSEGGDAVDRTYVRSVFYPFLDREQAARNPATQQYLDLVDRSTRGGKVAYLGVQGLSAWLLFATAARDCGADLTRDCVWERMRDVTRWTGGGLHAPQDVAGGTPPDCYVLFEARGGRFVMPDIGATDGVYACDPGTVIRLQGDYGEGARCPDPAFADDPRPSNCAA